MYFFISGAVAFASGGATYGILGNRIFSSTSVHTGNQTGNQTENQTGNQTENVEFEEPEEDSEEEPEPIETPEEPEEENEEEPEPIEAPEEPEEENEEEPEPIEAPEEPEEENEEEPEPIETPEEPEEETDANENDSDVSDADPLKNGRIKIELEDGSTETLKVFKKGKKKPIVIVAKNGKHIYAIKKSGKNVAVVNAHDLKVVKRVKLGENIQDQAFLRLFKATKKKPRRLMAVTRKGDTIRVTALTAKRNTLKKKKTVVIKMENPGKIRVKKLSKKKGVRIITTDQKYRVKFGKKNNPVVL